MTILRNIECTVVVQESESVAARRSVHHRGGDDLVHCLVVLRPGRIMYQTSATAIHRSREERHAHRLVMRDALQCSDEVCSLEVLFAISTVHIHVKYQTYL